MPVPQSEPKQSRNLSPRRRGTHLRSCVNRSIGHILRVSEPLYKLHVIRFHWVQPTLVATSMFQPSTFMSYTSLHLQVSYSVTGFRSPTGIGQLCFSVAFVIATPTRSRVSHVLFFAYMSTTLCLILCPTADPHYQHPFKASRSHDQTLIVRFFLTSWSNCARSKHNLIFGHARSCAPKHSQNYNWNILISECVNPCLQT
jgi:hypothetical protein